MGWPEIVGAILGTLTFMGGLIGFIIQVTTKMNTLSSQIQTERERNNAQAEQIKTVSESLGKAQSKLQEQREEDIRLQAAQSAIVQDVKQGFAAIHKRLDWQADRYEKVEKDLRTHMKAEERDYQQTTKFQRQVLDEISKLKANQGG